jgi:hypothetical protein
MRRSAVRIRKWAPVFYKGSMFLPLHSKFAMLDQKEKHFLFDFTSKLKADSVILEVGTFLGGSASIMASSNPKITVHSVDNYNDTHDRHKPEIVDMLQRALGDKSRTLESVQDLVSKYKNVRLHKGNSPVDFQNWDIPVDVYVEDGSHANPVFQNNVNFWTKFLRKDGYLILHDHRPFLPDGHPSKFPDVINLVKDLSDYEVVDKVESLIVLKKLV